MKTILQLKWITPLVIIFSLAGCGTTVGNPLITLSSAPYTLNTSPILFQEMPSLRSQTQLLSSVQSFKFCVTKLKLESSEGTFVQKNGADSIEAVLGLIDLSNGSVKKQWGQVQIPTNFYLNRLSVELHKDKDKCAGAEYSLEYYNGINSSKNITKDMEFKFKFNPAIYLQEGNSLTLTIDAILTKLDQAATAGKLDDTNIDSFLDSSTEGSGNKD